MSHFGYHFVKAVQYQSNPSAIYNFIPHSIIILTVALLDLRISSKCIVDMCQFGSHNYYLFKPKVTQVHLCRRHFKLNGYNYTLERH